MPQAKTTAARLAELETLAQLSASIIANPQLDSLLQHLIAHSQTGFQLTQAYIYLLNPDGTALSPAARTDTAALNQPGWQIEINHPHATLAQAVRTQKPIIISNVAHTQNQLPQPNPPQSGSQLALPLHLQNKILGGLDLYAAQVDHFTPQHLPTYTILAAQLALAIENARLQQQIQTILRQSEQRLAQEQILRRITDRIRGSVEVETVLRLTAKELGQSLNRPVFITLNHQSDPPLAPAQEEARDQ